MDIKKKKKKRSYDPILKFGFKTFGSLVHAAPDNCSGRTIQHLVLIFVFIHTQKCDKK